MNIVNKIEYAKVREGNGSQRDVARKLGVDIRTIQRREAGEIAITGEATRALLCLSALERVRQLIERVKDNGIRQDLDAVAILLEAH